MQRQADPVFRTFAGTAPSFIAATMALTDSGERQVKGSSANTGVVRRAYSMPVGVLTH